MKLGRLAKLLIVRLRQKPLFYQLVAQLSPLGASLVWRDVTLEGDETSTSQEIAKIIKMLYYIQHILQKKTPPNTFAFFFFLTLW